MLTACGTWVVKPWYASAETRPTTAPGIRIAIGTRSGLESSGEPVESAADLFYFASFAESVQGTRVNSKPHRLTGPKDASVFGEHLPGFCEGCVGCGHG